MAGIEPELKWPRGVNEREGKISLLVAMYSIRLGKTYLRPKVQRKFQKAIMAVRSTKLYPTLDRELIPAANVYVEYVDIRRLVDSMSALSPEVAEEYDLRIYL